MLLVSHVIQHSLKNEYFDFIGQIRGKNSLDEVFWNWIGGKYGWGMVDVPRFELGASTMPR
jgi:hypothetical protein